MLPEEIWKKVEELGELILDYIAEDKEIMKKINELRKKGYHVSITLDAFEDIEEDEQLDKISKMASKINSKDREFLKKLKIKIPDDNN
ncbi:hypothetical protein TTHT_2228 [Thermotomaculum hydrothermale]|uniref:Uncharacterized protein n=1 Tax=Thermotomaculum hydrothermale TaxID=981385 RepID=A0A7R6PP64_9BACT|nr:hypothetical protein [Thermotomaculum hydrothermale]BBB33652.1 hypothetical protein TTHT_2228 [Thermotomaculum hydrothermale]